LDRVGGSLSLAVFVNREDLCMEVISNPWVVGVIALAIGLFIGRVSSSSPQPEALAEQLNDARRELADYKEQVSGHFTKTAELVNQLTDSYKHVHQHLSTGAEGLCDSELFSNTLESPLKPQALTDESSSIASQVIDENSTFGTAEPPKDYAPKKDPAEEGTLSERYGMNSESDEDALDPYGTKGYEKQAAAKVSVS
jgi:uncharacterized membrane-anchored protein YhcB (DUF1043 family)